MQYILQNYNIYFKYAIYIENLQYILHVFTISQIDMRLDDSYLFLPVSIAS
jgi:hypothetical protein